MSFIRLLYQSLFRLWLRSALWRKNIYGVLGSIFSSLVRRRYVFLIVTRRLVLLPMVMYVFMRSISSVAFIFPIHSFIHELLDYFKIALGQLVPNTWVSC